MTFTEIQAKSALTELKRKIPYGWDLNIYRGCQHGCRYCYAMYSHGYLGNGDFFNDIYVKTNIVEALERNLASKEWKGEVINIGGVTDSYQPAEAHCKLMPEILRLMIKYKNPVIISTKSKLIMRDYDLIDELSKFTYVNIAETITTMDESVRRKLEPCSCSSIERFEVLKEFRKTNASIGVHVMPIIPMVTDSEENLDAIISGAAECGAHYLLPGTLYLRGATRKYFLEFMEKEYPETYERVKSLYKTGGAGKEYKAVLYEMVNRLRNKYNVSSSYMKPMREKLKKQ